MNRHERRKAKRFENKAQHFVAKGYTKAWCDPTRAPQEEPFVWLMDRDGPTEYKPAKRRAPKNIFSEPDMYTIRSADDPEARDLRLEHGLGRIEAAFCAVRRDYVEARRPLGPEQRAPLYAFAAAAQWRTPGAREHIREEWQSALDKMKAMQAAAENWTPERRAREERLSAIRDDDAPTMDMEDVEKLVAAPLQLTLPTYMKSLVPLYARMKLSIICTEKAPGFITGDEPVVWFDPEAYKRPPFFQSPGLGYPTIEVTMPISPTRMMLISHMEFPEYFDIDGLDLDDRLADDLNRRTCRHARSAIIVSRNTYRSIWAEMGKPPNDATAV